MAIACVAGLVEALNQAQILDADQGRELATLAAHLPNPRDLARELMQRGWLTAFQVNLLFMGRPADLSLGPFILQERLGEGGMGQVFKARHRSLGRVVAVKVLRKECLNNPNALPRFQREIQAAAQLDHPNVVRALDADQVGGTYFFAMEYIEGTDLSQLVKQHGPLSVLQACDYARQAALGLQHAHERGLIHRDIKPANLLVARAEGPKAKSSSAHLPRPFASAYRWGVVKILDMGLARLLGREGERGSTLLTQVGSVMGTPDFIAPEQARNSHTSDIRADLYSLGGTLYFLLCGQVPFPGGTLTEKLLQHQLDEPAPVERARRDRLLKRTPTHADAAVRRHLEIPAAVAALVRRLMAKRPDNRYQTPGELAGALGELSASLEEPRPARPRLRPSEKTLIVDATVASRPPTPPPTPTRAARNEQLLANLPTRPRKAPCTQLITRAALLRRRWLGAQTRGRLVFCGLLLLAVLSGRAAHHPAAEALPPPRASGANEAEVAWTALTLWAEKAGANRADLRARLLAFRAEHPGTPYALQAAAWLTRLPSPLDALQASAIPRKDRSAWFPKELVAVLGERRPFLASPTMSVAFGPDGGQVARGGSDQLVRRWQFAPLRELPPLCGHRERLQPCSLAYALDGRTLASGDLEGVVTLWDAATGKPRKTWRAHKYPLEGVAFTPNGRVLVTGGWDGMVRLWDGATGSPLRTLPGREDNRVLSVAVSPDGRLVACGHEDQSVRLWDLSGTSREPRLVYRGHSSWVKVVAFSPDGRTLVTGGGGDGTMRVCTWDGAGLRSGPLLAGHSNVVNGIAFAPDGKTVASASEDQSVRVWDVATGRQVRAWPDLRAAMNGVAFAPDGRHLAVASGNSTVYILRLTNPPRRD